MEKNIYRKRIAENLLKQVLKMNQEMQTKSL